MGSESEAPHYAYPAAECTNDPTCIRFLTIFDNGRQKGNARGRTSLGFWRDETVSRKSGASVELRYQQVVRYSKTV